MNDTLSQRPTRRRHLVRQLRESVWDWDVLVDDARKEINVAVQRLRFAVAERDRLAAHLEAAITAEVEAQTG